MENIERVCEQFAFCGEFSQVEELKSGNINSTYHLTYEYPHRECILQRINHHVFKKPGEVMENVLRITGHLAAKYRAAGIDPTWRVLKLVPLHTGEWMYISPEGEYWRAYEYIAGAAAPDRADTPAQFREAGRGFGVFQNMLADFPADQLHVTIPGFHDTCARFDALERAAAEDAAGRAAEAAPELDYLRAHREELCRISTLLDAGGLPLRVTHNDTKINNVMMDMRTGEALCVIDLDTVMPGTLLWDFGDAIRFGASTAPEDEPDVSKIALNMEYFAAFTEGFLAGVGKNIEPAEVELLPLSVAVMTGELAARFLTDYLNGDTYFKTGYPQHNMVRTRAQIALLKDVLAKRDEMTAAVRRCTGK